MRVGWVAGATPLPSSASFSTRRIHVKTVKTVKKSAKDGTLAGSEVHDSVSPISAGTSGDGVDLMLNKRDQTGKCSLPVSASGRPFSERLTVLAMRQFDKHVEAFTGPMRRHFPVISTRWFSMVTLRADVLEVLAKPDIYAVPYAPRLPQPFIVGSDDRERHAADWALLAQVLRRDDFSAITAQVAASAEQRVSKATSQGYLDVGADLVSPVMGEVVRRFLGLPGLELATQVRWARAVFHDLFLNPWGLQSVHLRANRAAGELQSYLERAMAERRAELDAEPRDVLGRLLVLQSCGDGPSDAEVMGVLIGLATAWLVDASRGCLLALDELVSRPEVLTEASAAANAGDQERLRAIVWELMRFRPTSPGVLRTCLRDDRLPSRGGRVPRLRSGSAVFVATKSAMWDASAVPEPARFRSDRPKGAYLMFGYGLHRCFGQEISEMQLPALLAPLLRRPRPTRGHGWSGRLRWDGLFPDGFRVTLS